MFFTSWIFISLCRLRYLREIFSHECHKFNNDKIPYQKTNDFYCA